MSNQTREEYLMECIEDQKNGLAEYAASQMERFRIELAEIRSAASNTTFEGRFSDLSKEDQIKWYTQQANNNERRAEKLSGGKKAHATRQANLFRQRAQELLN